MMPTAIKAIRFSALDYLLKPIDIDELLEAVNRYRLFQHKEQYDRQYASMLKNLQTQSGQFEKLAIPTMEGMAFVETKEIIYCQAESNYTIVHLHGKRQHLVSKTLKDFENLLTDNGFCRVHHASLINLKHIQKYVKGEGGYVILADDHHVNISRRKKEEFLRRLSIL